MKLVFLFIVLSASTALQTAPPKVKIVPAAYLKQVSGVTVYEKTTKIVFKIPLPIFPEAYNSYDVHNKNSSNLASILLDDWISEFQPASKTRFRSKRQALLLAGGAVAGYNLHSLVSKAFLQLFGSDDDLRTYVSNLRQSVVGLQHDILVIEKEVKGYADDLRVYLTESQAAFAKGIEDISHAIMIKIQRDWYVEGKFACLLRTIPVKYISHEILYNELLKLNNKLGQFNKTLAIPYHEFSRYYKIPVVDCIVTPSQIVVVVNVPIKRVGRSWKLYEMFHTKFAFQNQTCSVYPQEANYIASSSSKSVLITNHLLKHCTVAENGMCMIPEFTKDSSESLHCAVGILEGKPVAELMNYCAFRCSTNTELVVQELDDSTIVLTNAISLEIRCPNSFKILKFERLGAIELKHKCNCTMLVNENYLIEKPMYCQHDMVDNIDIYITTPNLWSAMNTAFGKHSLIFEKHTNITLNEDWPTHIPVLNLTTKSYTPIAPVPVSNLSYKDIWLVLLTAVVIAQLLLTWQLLRIYRRNC